MDLTPQEWFEWAHKLVTVGLAIAFFLFRTGRAIGARDATVDIKLEQIQRVNECLAEIRDFVEAAGKKSSDKMTQLQGFLAEAQLLLREADDSRQEDTQKTWEMIATLRERITRCETMQGVQTSPRFKEIAR